MLTLASILPPQAFTRYDSSGEPYLLASERMLVALRTLGWAAYGDVFAALDACTPEAQQRARMTLVGLVKRGLVVRRGKWASAEFQINAAVMPLKKRTRRRRA